MVPLRNVLLVAFCTCDSLLRCVDSWGTNILGSATEENCKAGEECSSGEDPGDTWFRGARLRPEPTGEPRQTGWPWDFAWPIKISIRMINDAATTSLLYCGTLCTSIVGAIGLAARWSYWLATALVAIFLLQLLVWTFNWVLVPAYKHVATVWRYLKDKASGTRLPTCTG